MHITTTRKSHQLIIMLQTHAHTPYGFMMGLGNREWEKCKWTSTNSKMVKWKHCYGTFKNEFNSIWNELFFSLSLVAIHPFTISPTHFLSILVFIQFSTFSTTHKEKSTTYTFNVALTTFFYRVVNIIYLLNVYIFYIVWEKSLTNKIVWNVY